MVAEEDVIINSCGIENFLREYPGMSIVPSRSDNLFLKGELSFDAQFQDHRIADAYQLKIEIPYDFPRRIPRVWELDRKIPRDGNFHINPDETLCLGSPLQIAKRLSSNPTLCGFTRHCLVPFLFAVSKKRRDGLPFFMGELQHGVAGIIDDYQRLFKVDSKEKIFEVLRLASQKRRYANKRPCACGCGKRLGVCSLRTEVNNLRKTLPRSWFRNHINQLRTMP
jgi:hypothetical protein